jgi:hypothetical protein
MWTWMCWTAIQARCAGTWCDVIQVHGIQVPAPSQSDSAIPSKAPLMWSMQAVYALNWRPTCNSGIVVIRLCVCGLTKWIGSGLTCLHKCAIVFWVILFERSPTSYTGIASDCNCLQVWRRSPSDLDVFPSDLLLQRVFTSCQVKCEWSLWSIMLCWRVL